MTKYSHICFLPYSLLYLFVLGSIAWVVAFLADPPFTLTEQGKSYLQRNKVMITMNLINSESVLKNGLIDTLLALAQNELFKQRLYISIYENGSEDNTKELLQALSRDLKELNVPHTITTDDGYQSLKKRVEGKFYENGDPMHIGLLGRIQYLSGLRNIALKPLTDTPSNTEREFFLQNKDKSYDRVLVLFINDIIVRESDVLRLLTTNDGAYDAVCANDFANLNYYDEWVARDVRGQFFDSWYPRVLEPVARQKYSEKQPFRVFSCWGGMAVLDGDIFTKQKIRFRGIKRQGESINVNLPLWAHNNRNLSVSEQDLTINGAPFKQCDQYHGYAQSECLLIYKDMWERGYDRVYSNPLVTVAYSRFQWILTKNILPIFELTVGHWVSWLHDYSPQSGDSSNLDILRENARKFVQQAPPLNIECRLDDQESIRYLLQKKVYFEILWGAILIMLLSLVFCLLASHDIQKYKGLQYEQSNSHIELVSVEEDY